LKTGDIRLKYVDAIKGLVPTVSLSDILYVGAPIDDNGDDMELLDDRLYDKEGKEI